MFVFVFLILPANTNLKANVPYETQGTEMFRTEVRDQLHLKKPQKRQIIW